MKRKPKTKRRSPLKIFYWFLASTITLLALGYILFTHRPGHYNPPQPRTTDEVNPYLHELGKDFHNGIELNSPFEVLVLQDKLNQVIADGDMLGWDWPITLNGVTFSTPMVVLEEDRIILMGKVDFGISFVASIIIAPEIDENGLFYLNIKKIKAGALNITKLSKSIGGNIMAVQVQDLQYKQWLLDLSGALLENAPYEPIYPIPPQKKQIRLTYIDMSEGKLVIRFAPAGPLD